MPGAFQGGKKQIPSRPGRGGDFSPASAVEDLGLDRSDDTMLKNKSELDEIKRRKKFMSSQAPLGSASAAALMGTPY